MYGKLIWSAGGRARRLTCAGHSVKGVHTLRGRADADHLLTELPGAQRIVVIGGGYIGLEAAATLAKLGKQITVLESGERVLARVAGPALAQFYALQHRSHGVDVRVNTTVECIEHREGRVAGVRLSSAQVLPAELVIVGIGILPEIEALAQAGARVGNGVEVGLVVPDQFPRCLRDRRLRAACQQLSHGQAGRRACAGARGARRSRAPRTLSSRGGAGRGGRPFAGGARRHRLVRRR